jgi:hypothetical protein
MLLAAACSSGGGSGNPGGAGGHGQGGASAGSGGATSSGGTSGGAGGSTSGNGGAVGAGGAAGRTDAGVDSTAGGNGGATGTDAGVDAHADAVTVSDAALASNGAYVRTGWTGAYTCTGTCLMGNGDSPQDMPSLAFDGMYTTRWSTDRNQQDFWNAKPTLFPLYFTVDMKQVVNVSKVTIHPSCRDVQDIPGMLDLLVSVDGTTFTPVVMNHKPATPPGNDPCPPTATSVATDTLTFTTTPARFIQVKATQSLVNAHPTSGDKYWAIGEFYAYP